MISKSDLIVVLMGGPGSEKKISLASGQAVLKTLQAAGYHVEGLEVTDRQPRLPQDTKLAFNLIHGTFGEDGGLQAYLDQLNIPYTGAKRASSELAFDKIASKSRFLEKGIPTPKSELVDCSSGLRLPEMPIPYVLKPAKEGSSVGVKIVTEAAQAEPAMAETSRYGNPVLVEEFIQGRELTVGILGTEAFPAIEIIPPKDGWYDMATKYPWLSGQKSGSQYLCPAPLTEAEASAVSAAALAAHQSLGIEVYSRVDILLNSSGNPYVLEANTIPGMTETSLLPKSAAAAGYTFTDLCLRIAHLSLKAKS